jgi:hypothetical protein
MASKPKAVRKSVAFDESDADQALLDAIEMELCQKQYGSFGELCKLALHQFLLSREPTQSVILFMELERQLAELQSKFAQFEASGHGATLNQVEEVVSQVSQLEVRVQQLEQGTVTAPMVASSEPEPEPDPPRPEDPLLNRLGPLLEDF